MITISMRYKNTLTYFFMTAFGSYLSEQAYEKLLDYNWKLTLWSINECLSDFHTSEIAISIDILQGIWLLKQDETGLVYELDTNLARSYRQWSVDLPYDYSLSLVKSTGVNADKPNTKQEMISRTTSAAPPAARPRRSRPRWWRGLPAGGGPTGCPAGRPTGRPAPAALPPLACPASPPGRLERIDPELNWSL